ncbi:MAG: sigma-54-dependent Fis family transcriptional regulator [Halieaceae bacterium]|nr:sigma-54-dependent Fis family transcriptional regulator [Halieaceae bacterium]
MTVVRELVGVSRAIAQIRDLVSRVAPTGSSVLITGESGTGKEVVARGIHDQSGRAAGPFVAVNCGAIPGELLESELFGHEKGAFTGAIQARVGRFEQAGTGTLFLDEIGDMPQGMQVKLLRVLEERSFERVGSNKTQLCDVRIIAATHQDLEAQAETGKFRADLYYRLNVFPIEISPLRERPDDVQVIAERFLEGFNKQRGTSTKVSKASFDALRQYPWPGNARELSNLMERLTILHPDEQVSVSQLPDRWRNGASHSAIIDEPRVPDFLFSDDEPSVNDNAEFMLPGLTEEGIDLKTCLSEMERVLIVQALDLSGGVVAKAAKLLNLQRTTLVEKMRKQGLERSE